MVPMRDMATFPLMCDIIICLLGLYDLFLSSSVEEELDSIRMVELYVPMLDSLSWVP